MAEVYGEKPKKFTKEWWPYFWMYYKWQTIGIIAVVVFVAVTVMQCRNKIKYDSNINYVGTTYYSEGTLDKLKDALMPYAADANGNGRTDLFLQQMNVTNTPGQEETDYALQMKHDIELTSDVSFLYIYDKTEAEMMINRDSADATYKPVSEWLNGTVPEDKVLKSKSGQACAISAAGSELLKNVGMNADELYIAIRMNYEDTAVSIGSQLAAVNMANAILGTE